MGVAFTLAMARTSRVLLLRNASSADSRSATVRRRSSVGMSASRAHFRMQSRVMPCKIASSVSGVTSVPACMTNTLAAVASRMAPESETNTAS